MHVSTLAFFSIECLEVKVFLPACLEVFEISYAADTLTMIYAHNANNCEKKSPEFLHLDIHFKSTSSTPN